MKIIDDYHEVKLPKYRKGKVHKRSGLAPNPAELNIYDKLYAPQSYDNWGNPQPYGTNGVATISTSPSAGCGEGLSEKPLRLKLAECLKDIDE